MTGGVNNNVNLNQLDQLKQLAKNNEIKKSDIAGNKDLISIFDQVNDTSNDENGVAVLKDAKELNPFRQAINNLISKLTGNSATKEAQETESSEKVGTDKDVQEFTNASRQNVADNDTLPSEVTFNPDGTKSIPDGNGNLHVNQNGGLEHTDENGNKTFADQLADGSQYLITSGSAIVQTPDGKIISGKEAEELLKKNGIDINQENS